MKFAVLVTFDISPEQWRGEYGLADTESAVADITDVLTRAASDGDFADAIVAGWPMMGELATITVSPIGA